MLKCLIIFNKFQRLAGRIGQSVISQKVVFIFLHNNRLYYDTSTYKNSFWGLHYIGRYKLFCVF